MIASTITDIDMLPTQQKGGGAYSSTATTSESQSTYTLQRWYDTSKENEPTPYGRVAEGGKGSRVEASQYRTEQKLQNFTDWFVTDSYAFQSQYYGSEEYTAEGHSNR
jgi:hypothetical protein